MRLIEKRASRLIATLALLVSGSSSALPIFDGVITTSGHHGSERCLVGNGTVNAMKQIKSSPAHVH